MERAWDSLERGKKALALKKEEERKKAKAARLRKWIETGEDPWEVNPDNVASTVMVVFPHYQTVNGQRVLSGNYNLNATYMGMNASAIPVQCVGSVCHIPMMTATQAGGSP